MAKLHQWICSKSSPNLLLFYSNEQSDSEQNLDTPFNSFIHKEIVNTIFASNKLFCCGENKKKRSSNLTHQCNTLPQTVRNLYYKYSLWV